MSLFRQRRAIKADSGENRKREPIIQLPLFFLPIDMENP